MSLTATDPGVDSEITLGLVQSWFAARAPAVRSALIREQVRRIEQTKAAAALSSSELAVLKRVLATDPIRFINDWVWTTDPRNLHASLPVRVPLKLRPKQVEFVHWLEDKINTRQNGLVEKSRDEGMTWVMCAYFVHGWLFKPRYKAGIGSRKLDLVDHKNDPDSIFEKIRFIIRNLPNWLKPAGYDERAHANYCRMINPENEAAITGEGGDDIGRGGRNLVYFVDEHAKIERPELVDQSLSQNATTIIYGSTPRGVGNLFYQKRFSGRLPVFTFNWRDNPDKSWAIQWNGKTIYPWYEEQKLKLDNVSLAQEVDIDYTASVEGVVIPAAWVLTAFELELTATVSRTAGLDVSDEGEDDTAYCDRSGPVVQTLERIHGTARIAGRTKELARATQITVLYYDRLGVGAAITATLAADHTLPFTVTGIANNSEPTGTIYPDNDAPATLRFVNYAAELWWRLRLRFRNTFERVREGKPHPDSDCISLTALNTHPLRQSLVAQLSQPTYQKIGVSDKIRVNKFGQGTASPDLAESLMYAFAAPRAVKRNPQGTSTQQTWG